MVPHPTYLSRFDPLLYLLDISCRDISFRIRSPCRHRQTRAPSGRPTGCIRPQLSGLWLSNSCQSGSLWNPDPSHPSSFIVTSLPDYPSLFPLSYCSNLFVRFSKFAFIQLPVFAIFLRYKYFNTAYTRHSLRELSLLIDRLVEPLPPAAKDVWGKIRDAISYYGTRPLVAGEGAPNATNAQGTATGTQRSTSGTAHGRM